MTSKHLHPQTFSFFLFLIFLCMFRCSAGHLPHEDFNVVDDVIQDVLRRPNGKMMNSCPRIEKNTNMRFFTPELRLFFFFTDHVSVQFPVRPLRWQRFFSDGGLLLLLFFLVLLLFLLVINILRSYNQVSVL